MVMLLLSDLTLGVKESVSSDLCDCDKVQASQTFIMELFECGDSPLRCTVVGLFWKRGYEKSNYEVGIGRKDSNQNMASTTFWKKNLLRVLQRLINCNHQCNRSTK